MTEQGFRGVFRVVGRDDQQGPAVANYLAGQNKPKTVAVIDDATAYGEGLANEVEKTLKAAGIKVLPREKGTDKTVDWKAVLTKLKGKRPDAVFYGGMDATAGPLIKQARELKITAVFAFGDGACTDKMAELAGPAAEGLLCSQAGIPVQAAGKKFLDAYKAKFKVDPILYSPFTYDSANLLIAAMKKADSADPAKYLPALAASNHNGASVRPVRRKGPQGCRDDDLNVEGGQDNAGRHFQERQVSDPLRVRRTLRAGPCRRGASGNSRGWGTRCSSARSGCGGTRRTCSGSSSGTCSSQVSRRRSPPTGKTLSAFPVFMFPRDAGTVSSGFERSPTMDILLQQIINGLTTGSVYAVVALGYTMVYGVIQLINFAHGEVVMIGAMVAFSVISALAGSSLPPLLIVLAGVIAAIPACMVMGYLLERAAYRPLRHAPRLAPLITAIGMSIILQHLALLVWGRNPLAFPQIIDNRVFGIGGAAISSVQIAIIALSLTMMAGLSWFVYRTRFGIAIRATAENVHVAGLMGINADRVIAATFVIGAGLGAVAGVMYGSYYGIAHYTMGFSLGLKAFSAAVLGGIGNIAGPCSAASCSVWWKR